MSGWQTTFDNQMALWRFWRTDLGKRALTGFTADMRSKGRLEGSMTDEWLWQGLTSMLFNADPFYVAPDMMELLEASVDSFVPEPLVPTDIITQHGFVMLPHPLFIPDVHGRMIGFRAFSWMPAVQGNKTGIFLALYSCNEDKDDYDPIYGDDTEARTALGNVWKSGFALLHFAPWMFEDAELLEKSEGDPDVAGWRTFTKHAQVFFRLTMQYVAERQMNVVPRASRRRAGRENFPAKNVVVVRLRRPKSHPTGDERSVEWSCQWIVSGHWRNQWYPKLNCHRQVWISGYVKGPEDKELRLRKTRAFELIR